MQVSDNGTDASRSLRYWLGCPSNSADSQAGIAAVSRQSPIDRREQLHLLIEEGEQHQWMPVDADERMPPTASRGPASATRRNNVTCAATSQLQPGTPFPKIAINAAVIAGSNAVSVVVQRAKSTGGIGGYDPNMPGPQRLIRTFDRKRREARMVARGFQSAESSHPGAIIPIRRCNLACTYCNEFDKHSAPVPLRRCGRIDQLASLARRSLPSAAASPCCTPTRRVIRHIRGRGVIAGLITNGYLLTAERIRAA